MTQEECVEFLEKVRKDIPWIREGVVEITEEMRARYEKKKQQALQIAELDVTA